MISSRRNFMKATAAMSVLGSADAHAYSNSDHWISFLHSTHLHDKGQASFLGRLRANNYEGDPQRAKPATGKTGVNIHYFNAGSRYQSSSNQNLQNALSSMINELPAGEPQVLVVTGGMVSALAIPANLKKSGSTTDAVPILVLMGRSATLSSGNTIGGYYIDKLDDSGINLNLQQKAQYLFDNYQIPYKNQWLIYNGNSNMGDKESTEWPTILNSLSSGAVNGAKGTNCKDASFTNTDNNQIDVKQAIHEAVNATNPAQAIVISGDPHFLTIRGRIVHQGSKIKTADGKSLIMCYPFQEYDDEAKRSGLDYSTYMIWGPKLEDAYGKLGDAAATILKGGSFTSVTPIDSSYSGRQP